MLDIDNFKKNYDLHGHDIGDSVLTHFAEILDRNIRASDFAFRFSGEEFLILLSECDAYKAKEIIDNIARLRTFYQKSR